MAVHTPNTVCKNVNCRNGADGGRKHYYTCRYCVHSLNWRSVACCEECYLEYMAQVEAARRKSEDVDLYPERTDLSRDELVALVEHADFESVIQQTEEELAEELEENPDLSFGEIVDKINGK